MCTLRYSQLSLRSPCFTALLLAATNVACSALARRIITNTHPDAHMDVQGAPRVHQPAMLLYTLSAPLSLRSLTSALTSASAARAQVRLSPLLEYLGITAATSAATYLLGAISTALMTALLHHSHHRCPRSCPLKACPQPACPIHDNRVLCAKD